MSQVTTAAQTVPGEQPAPELDGIADVRPRLRHDVVFADTGFGAFVRNTDTGFLIRGKSAYRWLATLVPYFDGNATVAELCDGLNPEQTTVITSMLRTLLERGFVRDSVPEPAVDLPAEVIERFRSQIDFIAHFADDAVTRFARYRRAGVLIVGDGDTSRAIAAGLLRNGSESVEIRRPGPLGPSFIEDTADGQILRSTGPVTGSGHDMLVICADEVGPAAIWQACESLTPDGPAVLPVLTLGRQAFLGPVTRHGASPCWGCLLLRLQANTEAGDLARLWQAIATAPRDGDGYWAGQRLPSASVAQIVGSAAAFDVFRLLTEALIGESAGAVLAQDVDTLESTRERLLPHPECGWCHGDGPPAAAGPAPEDLLERDSDEPLSEEEIHERQLTLVRKHVGIVTAFTDHGLTQSPLKVARCRLGGEHAALESRELTAFGLDTLLGARQAVLQLAALTYVDRLADLRAAVTAGELPAHLRLAGSRLRTASGAPLPADPMTRHLPATDLRTGDTLWLPAAAVHPAGSLNAAAAFEPTSAGSGAGLDVEQATERGLLSALAYDGLRAAVNGAGATAIDAAEIGADEQLNFLATTAGRLGVTVTLIRLPEAAPAHAVLAVATGGARTRWSVAASLDPRDAAVTALRDAVGQAQLDAEGVDFDLGAGLLADFDPAALKVSAARPASPAVESTEALLALLAADGRQALRVVTTTPDLDLVGVVHTVRVLLADAG